MYFFHRQKPRAMKATTKRERESLEQHLSAREVDARTDFARTTDPFSFVTAMLTASGAEHTVIDHDKEYTTLKVRARCACLRTARFRARFAVPVSKPGAPGMTPSRSTGRTCSVECAYVVAP